MKKIKWIILILSIVLIISIILLFAITNSKNIKENEEGDEGEVIDYENQQTEQVTNGIDFYTVNNCINQYFDVINLNSTMYYGYNENNEYSRIISDDEIKENINSLLSSKFINERGITLDNIFENINTVEEEVIFMSLKMNSLAKANIETYSVYGIAYTFDNTYIGDYYFIVNLDRNNFTFSIEPLENGQYNDINEIQLENDDNFTIEANYYNQFTEEQVNYEYLAKQYVNSYKTLSLVKPEFMYELIDEEYRNAKFGNLEQFEKYIEDNRENIQKINLQKFRVDNSEDYIQYICIDQNGRYYIFDETAIMDYKVILDIYTIDLPEFTQEYNNSTDAEKVLLNIQKVFSAINDGDYNYVYNKLDNTFRQNNFPTLESFETYITQNFYENNSIAYSNYQTSGNLHIYEISITNTNDENSTTITKNFIMQLLDGTDFVMSFSV